MSIFLVYSQEVVSKETIKVLSKGQYCVIKDVVDKHGTPQLGKRELRVGPCSFFLHPGKQNIDKKNKKLIIPLQQINLAVTFSLWS